MKGRKGRRERPITVHLHHHALLKLEHRSRIIHGEILSKPGAVLINESAGIRKLSNNFELRKLDGEFRRRRPLQFRNQTSMK